MEIVRGEIWNCRLGDQRGLAALDAILRLPEPRIEFLPLSEPSQEREITGSTSSLLLALTITEDGVETGDEGESEEPAETARALDPV